MTTKKKVVKKTGKRARKRTPEKFQSIALINETLTRLENQALKAYECLHAIKKQRTPDWKKWIEKLSPQDWLALAGAQKDRIGLEVRTLSDEILSKIYGADILNGKDKLLQETKQNLENIINRIEKSDLVEKAIDTAIHTRDGLLTHLNIPTHDEMITLQKKLKKIEKEIHEHSGKRG